MIIPHLPPLIGSLRQNWDAEADTPEFVYVRIANHIAAQIESGHLKVGARLEGERELAEHYSVSVATARRAMEELRERGLAKTLHGKGTYVTKPER